MKKFAVFGGFLGSGKTTAMMALTRYHGKAAMITNDLGGDGLADYRLARLRGCNATELTGDCICYQTEKLVERLNSLFDGESCQLVVSDIPGFGVGALEHVYHTLQERYPGQYDLAPFTVLVEPQTVKLLQENSAGDVAYILNAQLQEADLIVLNKCDLLDAEEKAAGMASLRSRYPQARVIGISALTGEGIESLSRILTQDKASMHRPDIGYGGEAFAGAMERISEYYIQYYAAVCCDDFDGNAYLLALAEAAQAGTKAQNAEIPHLKLLAWDSEGEYGKVDLLGMERPAEVNQTFCRPCTELAVVLNASAVCSAEVLDGILTGAVETVSQRYQLELIIYKKECFGMG